MCCLNFVVAPHIDRKNLQKKIIRFGQTLKIEADVKGEPPPKVVWTLKDKTLSSADRFVIWHITRLYLFKIQNTIKCWWKWAIQGPLHLITAICEFEMCDKGYDPSKCAIQSYILCLNAKKGHFLCLKRKAASPFFLILSVLIGQWPVQKTDRQNKGVNRYSTRLTLLIKSIR